MQGVKTEVFDIEKIRNDFPILNRVVNGKPLIYLDSAATSQKPAAVISALSNFYEQHNSNVHRAVHTLSQEATDLYDGSREKIAKFINADFEEIVFVKNATEAVNVVLYGWAIKNLKAGDEIISTVMEHHSNIVPWQSLQSRGVKLKFVDIDENGNLDIEQFGKLLSNKTKLVTFTHVSNVLGTINPVKQMVRMAHDHGALALVDGAQSVPHMPVDVRDIGCDFLVFSGHKMLGPTGTGCLFGKREILEEMDTFMLGSDMIKEVKLHETSFRESPWKFEPGTPDFAGAFALGIAVDYLRALGMKNVHQHGQEIVQYALKKLANIDKLQIYGPKERCGVVSFNLGDIHSHDVSSLLDGDGIAVRSGHRCAQPLMTRLGIASAARASFYIYNTKSEVDMLVDSLEKAKKVFKL